MKIVIAAAAEEPRANTLVLFKKDLQSRNTVMPSVSKHGKSFLTTKGKNP